MIQSNLSEVVGDVIGKLSSLGDADKVLRTAAFDTVALISDRVQQDGLKSDGGKIGSFYSRAYGDKRRKKGLQTQFIDLTFTGKMLDDFTVTPDGSGSFVAGFISEKAAQTAEFNEQRYGTIFHLSDEELEILTEGVIESVNDILRG